jgi:hypothetical protein
MSWDQLKAIHGKASANELTRVEASQFIDRLKGIQDDKNSGPKEHEYNDEAAAAQRGMETLSGNDPDRYTY